MCDLGHSASIEHDAKTHCDLRMQPHNKMATYIWLQITEKWLQTIWLQVDEYIQNGCRQMATDKMAASRRRKIAESAPYWYVEWVGNDLNVGILLSA